MDTPQIQSGWGWYGAWTWEADLFHPEDQHLKEEMLKHGDVCECTGQEGEFLVLGFSDLSVRLRARLTVFRPIPAPVFRFGDLVMAKPPRTARAGHISRIVWHAKRREPLFWISGSTARAKTRYFSHELTRIES